MGVGSRRGWSIGFLLFGAVAFVAGPFSESVAAFVSLSGVESSGVDSGVDRQFDSAGAVPGVVSERFGRPVVAPVVGRGVDDGAPVVDLGRGLDPNAEVGAEVLGERTEFSQSFRRSD